MPDAAERAALTARFREGVAAGVLVDLPVAGDLPRAAGFALAEDFALGADFPVDLGFGFAVDLALAFAVAVLAFLGAAARFLGAPLVERAAGFGRRPAWGEARFLDALRLGTHTSERSPATEVSPCGQKTKPHRSYQLYVQSRGVSRDADAKRSRK